MPEVQVRVGASVDSSLVSAMQPIIATAKRARQVVQSEAEAASKAQDAAFTKAAKSGQKAYEQIVAAAAKASAKEAAEAQRSAQAKVKADQRAFDQKIKALERGAAAAEKASAREATAAEKAAAKEIAAADKAAQGKVRAEQRAFDQKLRLSQRAYAQEEREILRTAALAERRDARAAAASAKEGRSGAVNFARNAAGNFRSIAGAAGRMGLGIARGAGANLDLGAAVGSVVEQQKIASQISNSGYLEGDARNGTRVNSTDLHHEARKAALGAGISTDDTLGGLQAMVGKSSDLATSRDMLADMAKLSAAMGAKMTDVGAAAGEISLRLGDVPNKAAVVTGIMSTIAQQGKVGAIEMREMAKNLGTVMASAGKFASGPEQAARDLGALFQVAKKGGSKNAAASATGVSSFVAGLTNPAELKRLNGMGINVFSDKSHTKFNDVGQIAAAALLKTGGDLGKLGGVFKNQRAMSVVSGLGRIYGDAEKGQKGSGVGAIQKYFKDMGKGMSQGDLQDSLKEAMGTSASKVQQFNTKIEEVAEKLAGTLLPALEKLAPLIVRAADALASMVQFAVENPGAAITAAIVASITKAAIGSAVAAALKALIGGGGGAGALGGAGGYLGAAGVGIGLGVGGAMALQGHADNIVNEAGDAQNDIQDQLAKVHKGRKSGSVGKDQEVAVQQLAAKATDLTARIRNAESSEGVTGIFNRLNGNIRGDQYDEGKKDLPHLGELKLEQAKVVEQLRALATSTLKVTVVNMPKSGGGGAADGFDTGEPEDE